MTAVYREAPHIWWYVDFTWNKTRVRRPAPQNTRKSAEKYEHDLRGQMQNPAPAPVVATLFKDFVDPFLTHSRNNNKAGTQYEKESVLRNHLIPRWGDTPLSAIGLEALEQYKTDKLTAGLVKKTINNHLVIISKFLRLANEYGKLDKVPKIPMFPQKDRFKPVKKDEFLDFAEAERFIAAARHDDAPIITLALKTGMRIGEIRALEWSSVDLVAGKLIVRHAFWDVLGPPKNGLTREIPLSGKARAALGAAKHLKGPYVFCNPDGSPLSYTQCLTFLERTERRAGLAVQKIRWHKLRHTFASHLVMKGEPLKVVQELLGHADLSMSLRYAHLSPAVRESAVERLDEAVGQ